MIYAFKFFVLLTAVLHCLFFKLESIDFMKEKTLKRLGLSKEHGLIIKNWAFNQGFYNLFLACGLFYSLFFMNVAKGEELGMFLTRYILIYIVGAAIVLFISLPKKFPAALIQGLPALLGFVFSFFI